MSPSGLIAIMALIAGSVAVRVPPSPKENGASDERVLRNPQPEPPAALIAGGGFLEQAGQRGANTYTNPSNASGLGPRIDPFQWVVVACKIHSPTIASANPDGYWYRVQSEPWAGAYYAAANTFWNGDVPGAVPYLHNTDFAVPDCASALPPQSDVPPRPATQPSAASPTSTAAVSLRQGDRAAFGHWYSVALRGFPPNSRVVVQCHDSKDSAFFVKSLRVSAEGTAVDERVCYSGDGPLHWVTAEGNESVKIAW